MILRALIDVNDDPDLRTGAKKLSGKVEPLEVCHVTIGETFAGLAEANDRTVDDCCDTMRAFHRMIKTGELQLCGFNSHKETHVLALKLHKEDPMLEPNDGLILANALLCRECRSFHTMDQKILFSKVVKSVAEEHNTVIVPFEAPETCKNRRKTY